MNATSSGVAFSAAKMRSPSFSRSSSSMTTTALPAAMSATALSTESNLVIPATLLSHRVARARVSTSMNHDTHTVIAAAFGAPRRRAHSWPRCDDHHRLEVLCNGSISVGPQGDLKAFISVSAGKLSAHEYSYARKAVAAPLYGRAGGRWYYRVRPRVGHGGRASGACSRTDVSLVPGSAMEPRLGQQLGLE